MMARLRKADPVLLGLWISLFVVAVLWIAPFVFITLTAFKTRPDLVRTGSFGLPTTLAWQNFSNAWDRANLATTALNSTVIALTKVPIGIFISSLAAYALTRMRFRGRHLLFLVIAIGTLIPIQVALAPLFRLILSMGLLNK